MSISSHSHHPALLIVALCSLSLSLSRQSAIVPLLHELLTGQQVVLYDESIIKGNPVCALVFLNSTSRTLEGLCIISSLLSLMSTFLS